MHQHIQVKKYRVPALLQRDYRILSKKRKIITLRNLSTLSKRKPLEGGHFSKTETDVPGSAQFHVNVCNLTLFKVHTCPRKTASAGREGVNALLSVQITLKWSHMRKAYSRAAALRNYRK